MSIVLLIGTQAKEKGFDFQVLDVVFRRVLEPLV
jgi:hypothetical protein